MGPKNDHPWTGLNSCPICHPSLWSRGSWKAFDFVSGYSQFTITLRRCSVGHVYRKSQKDGGFYGPVVVDNNNCDDCDSFDYLEHQNDHRYHFHMI